jgi:hypothetical protein
MTLGGNNDLVVQTAVFEEKCSTGCAVTNYKLQSWDTNSQNATAYGLDLSSAPQAVWPQTPKGGGIFAAFAINLGTVSKKSRTKTTAQNVSTLGDTPSFRQ